jgi:hypothetical protein
VSEIERTKQAIATVAAKRDAANDPESRRYYELCIAGWQSWLVKLERGELRSVRRR